MKTYHLLVEPDITYFVAQEKSAANLAAQLQLAVKLTDNSLHNHADCNRAD